MRFFTFYIVCFFCINDVFSQSGREFVLRCEIDGLADGSKLYLRTIEDTIASAVAKGGRFIFKGVVEGEANYYFILGDSLLLKGASEAIWLVNDSMSLKGELNSWPIVSLSGSAPHDDFKALRRLQAQAKASGQEIQALKKFIAAHTNSLYVPDLIMRMEPVLSMDEMSDAFNKLSDESKQSFFGEKLRSRIMQIREGNLLSEKVDSESKVIPDFVFVDVDGRSRSIHKAISTHKYTLIDFWASWCVPCRKAIPSIKNVYRDFNLKGFNVIGISIDKDSKKWKNSILEDRTSWIHGIDSLQTASKGLFGFIAIPAYILVDSKGNIIQSEFSSTKIRPKQGSSGLTLERNLHSIVSLLFSGKHQ